MKYWKEAASLIVAANRNIGRSLPISSGRTVNSRDKPKCQTNKKNSANSDTDYAILLMQRAQSSTFFAGAEVFPGGALDDADTSPDWLDLFKIAGRNDFGKMLSIQGPRPMIFANKSSCLPREIAFRICAIRETFEEAGILLLKSFQDLRQHKTEVTFAKNFQHPRLTEAAIDQWRHRVHNDAREFIVLCKELQCAPDVWSLMEWCDWLTPANNKKRYDTMFFLCCMKDAPEVRHDTQEMIQTKWSQSSEALQAYKDKEVYLPPPQIFELSRIRNYDKLQDLFDFSSQRSFLGCQTTFPVLYLSDDGQVVSTYPGDDAYPSKPDFKTISMNEMTSLKKTAEQSLQESRNLNRMVFYSSSDCSLYYNITPPCGHVAPIQFNIEEGAVQSKL